VKSKNTIKILLAVGFILSNASCYGAVVKEQFRLANPGSINRNDLGFVKGETTMEEAETIMQEKQMTGITKDEFAASPEKAYGFITADYQTRVHVFENFRYRESVELHPNSAIPYGFALRAAAVGEKVMLMALYRDPIAQVSRRGNGNPPRIDAFLLDDKGISRASTLSFERIAKENGGMSFPLFVGYDLSEGVIFVARSNEGETWKNAYILRYGRGELRAEPISVFVAAGCPSILSYMNGKIANRP